MSDFFHDRETTFEQQFANDETLRFRSVARRNKALALWLAEQKGVTGDAAKKFAEDFVGAQIGKSDDEVAAALRDELARADIDFSDHRLKKKVAEEMAVAVASVRSGK